MKKQATEPERARKKRRKIPCKGNGKNANMFYILKSEEEMATLSSGSVILLLKQHTKKTPKNNHHLIKSESEEAPTTPTFHLA